MALFDENVTIEARPRPRMSRLQLAGIWALAIALVALLVLTFLPSSFVIQRPGPVFNTLGTARDADGADVPLISVSGADTYPTAGALDLLTVQVVGNREQPPSWIQLAQAWFDPARAVVPIDDVFPAGQTSEQRNEQSAALMVDSQKEATAAALKELGFDVNPKVRVHSVVEGAASDGILRADDIILTVDGDPVPTTDRLRDAINAGDGDPVELGIERDGAERTVTVTPERAEIEGETRWAIGVSIIADYDFPIDVTIQLDNVGGPSAGMMFALGIIDTLTPGELNGGRNVAGTGTIDSAGAVGPIGGIRQKMHGAVGAGATYFLAPERNCGEVVGHVPDGLHVFSVVTIDDALDVLEAIREGDDLDALPTCTAG